ncbi:hypothetical protein M441DRAFT_267557 [Trichoderma asperellum CBS 433.97]|uniref:Uncharacterized protein n=1 Tax=Trichoderma asperellum (strain ATCC 204424 / CBS 433.97 / NBRC 101777) TaxID=1042311 RepID=A0A2T3YVU1_TRIA4|nr:hypothetical protein M441DRAFT_267557 [Trichoderma asperellum CBS 433.97]PTB36672.1 hypothetical protein M441DRAFT_267557 [Trichoderma asperellum CBS 433.97]
MRFVQAASRTLPVFLFGQEITGHCETCLDKRPEARELDPHLVYTWVPTYLALSLLYPGEEAAEAAPWGRNQSGRLRRRKGFRSQSVWSPHSNPMGSSAGTQRERLQ